MSEVGFSVSGVENVQKKIRLIEIGFKDAIEEAVLKSVGLVEADAKKIVPIITGRLARSITGGISKITRKEVTGTVGANTVYAASVEFGKTVDEAARAARRHTQLGQRPYLFPSLQKNMKNIRDLIAKAMKEKMMGFGE